MQQKYIVYFNRKTLVFNNPQAIQAQADGIITVPGTGADALTTGLNWLKENPFADARAVFSELDFEHGLEVLKAQFHLLRAAGGIVMSPQKRLLFIYRLGYWDLPKGKVEKGETVKSAAKREIMEETGIDGITNVGEICRTWHTYTETGKNILKETSWYAFSAKTESPLIPQEQESITEAKWIEINNLDEIRRNTYPSILDVLDADNRLRINAE